MEDPNNIGRVCNDCSEKVKVETQKNLPALSELVGKFVKKRFVEADEGRERVEHMWVRVASFNEEAGTLMGTLDNDPVVVANVSCGDEVIVYRDEIESVFEG